MLLHVRNDTQRALDPLTISLAADRKDLKIDKLVRFSAIDLISGGLDGQKSAMSQPCRVQKVVPREKTLPSRLVTVAASENVDVLVGAGVRHDLDEHSWGWGEADDLRHAAAFGSAVAQDLEMNRFLALEEGHLPQCLTAGDPRNLLWRGDDGVQGHGILLFLRVHERAATILP
ncbi:protein of unknown function [Acidithiobacillus ferrivorans]|uniref:Uncharacterized protein n=1 Tax=Acidithiobacillus ferrivorans TaxID=160808 RepID=A0A060UN10_9PROT|nr:hypothetical protein AFERRI_370091 [Acidithiobacillus ferrivorans]SMH65683.1 protein of unknown function [Acidithiobacillus ferrivorans]